MLLSSSRVGPDDKSMTTLSIDQTDELIRNAAQPDHGAIEDCEIIDTAVAYFFESDRIGTVCRRTGAVTFSAA
jgi:hypothetical protein